SYIAIYGEEDRYVGLTFVIDMAIMYLAVAVAFRRNEDWALFGGILAAVSGLVLTYATVQRLGLDPLRWDTSDKVFGTLGNSNIFGRFLSLGFGASVGVALLGAGRVGHPVRAVAALLALAILATAALSPVRGTLLAMAAVIVVSALHLIRSRGVTRRDLGLASLIVVGTAAALAAMLVFTPAGARALSLIRDPSPDQIRVLLADSAIRAFLDRPLLGHGPDSFAVVYPRYRQADEATFGFLADDTHDWLLQAAATTGALGVLAIAGGLLIAIWSAWRRRRFGVIGPAVLLASVAYWVHASVTVGSVGVDWFPFLAFGAAATMSGPPSSDPHPYRGLAVWPTALIIGVGAIAGSLTGASAFLANREAAVAAFEVNARPLLAIAAAESAVRRDPARAVYWYWAGRAHAANSAWPKAAEAFREAATLAPYERAYWGQLARSLAKQAEIDRDPNTAASAIAAARSGTDIDPNEPLTHVALAEVAYTLGRYDLSLQEAVTAITLYPRGGSDALAAQAAARASDLAGARSLLQGAIRVRDSAVLHLALARVALRFGDYGSARAEATRAAELEPGNADAEELLRAIGR
ncbi:MAG: O-antigen ligase family protein, partial [Chloroflexota bacterium]|nr:O-antigen ligase family protein [Chloroflexota bacterium]